jgi:hypothetical protein
MLKLSKLEQQIIWYTKGWFKVTNEIDDLKIIIGDGTAISSEKVEVWSVYYWVMKTFLKVIPQHLLKHKIENFFTEIYKYKPRDYCIAIEDMIREMCGELSTLKTRENDIDLIELGEPNYNLLPIN